MHLWSAVAAIAILANQASAQNFERYRPLQPGDVQPELPDLPEPGDLPEEVLDDRVLLPSLEAIRIVDHADKILKDASIDDLEGIHYDVDRSGLMHEPAIRSILQRNLGQPVTLRSINQLSREIIEAYRRCKLPIVDVVIPEQRITTGTLHLVIIESRIGEIKVRPGCYFDCDSVSRWIECTRRGDRIYEPRLENDLFWLNQNPFRRVGVDFVKGAQAGTTDVIFEVDDIRPLRGYIGIDDTGVETLNYGRFFTGFQYGNVLGRGGTLGYQYTADEDFARLNAHSLSLLQPLTRKYSAFVYGSWAGVSPALGSGLSQNGESYQFGGELHRHLIRDRFRQRDIIAGVEFKSTNNALEFAQTVVSNSTADLLQLRLGFRDSRRCGWDDFHSLSLDAFLGPGGGFTSHHNAAAFNTIRPGTSPDYFYSRAQFSAASVLGGNWAFHRRFLAQAASERLLFSETLGIGGFDTLRGTDQRVFNGDHGWIANLEIGPRTYEFGCPDRRRILRLYSFLDFGNGYVDNPQTGEDAYTMAISSGVGCRFQISDRLIARFDYGAALRNNIAAATRDNRAHFALTWIPGKRL